MNERQVFLETLASRIASLSRSRIQLVAIDGVDGAGKTTLANDLAPIIENKGRTVIRASVDGFHFPREVRYRNGKGPDSFFRDSYDYSKLKELLLDPLSPAGSGQYITAIFNVVDDIPVQQVRKSAGKSDVLLFDGIFLHRSELRNYWDLSLFLDVSFDKSIPRMAQRDFGSPDVSAESNFRYVEGQKIYLKQEEPQKRANIHIDYNDLSLPRILNRGIKDSIRNS